MSDIEKLIGDESPLEIGQKINEIVDYKANKNLNNTGMITNCLLEVPQRIKYDLVDGTLTIKAGSVVIVPYGTEDLTAQYPVGATFLNDNFKVADTQFEDGKFFVWAELQSDIVNITTITDTNSRLVEINLTLNLFQCVANNISGTTEFTGTGNCTNFRTDLNLVQKYSAGVLKNEVISLPTMLVQADGAYVAGSISQVFNGMGYIGSTVWCDKGVKGLIPNGRNEDGSLKNIEFTTTKLMTTTNTHSNGSTRYLVLRQNLFSNFTNNTYDSETNYNRAGDGVIQPEMRVGHYIAGTNALVTDVFLKQPFHAADIQDVVRKTGDTMTGPLELYGTTGNIGLFGGSIYTHTMDLGIDDKPSSNYYGTILQHEDKNKHRKSRIESVWWSSGAHVLNLSEKKSSTENTYANIQVGFGADGNAYTYAPHCAVNNGIVTQAGLSKSGNGYMKFGNGVIIQWGIATPSSNYCTVTFPTAFTSGGPRITATQYASDGKVGNNNNVIITEYSTTKFKVYTEKPVIWNVVGY